MRPTHILRRLQPPLGIGIVLLVLIGAVIVAGAFWIGPLKPLPPRIELVALDQGQRFGRQVDIDAVRDSVGEASGSDVRFPFLLAIRNAGTRPARPRSVSLSIPGSFQLTDADGEPLPARYSEGNPLVRYDFALSGEPIQPGALPSVVRGTENLRLVPALPPYMCILTGDVPDFVPAPRYDPGPLSRVEIFWSIGDGDAGPRQTGILTVSIDPARLDSKPVPEPPVFPAQISVGNAARPELGPLVDGGARSAQCGEPEHPITVGTHLWETAAGGRFLVVYHDTVPRKYLYDLDRDSLVELELWDSDGDGEFEGRRRARYPIPAYLLPRPKPAPPDTIAMDSAAADSTAATPPDSAPPARPDPTRSTPPDTTRRPAPVATRRDTTRRDTTRRDTTRGDTTRRDTLRRDTLRRDTLRRDTLRRSD